MRALVWHLRRVPRHLAWPWLLSVIVLLAAGAVYRERVLPGDEHLAALAAELDAVRNETAAPVVDTRPQTPGEQLEAFYAFFPVDSAQSDVLDGIFSAAAKENLALPQGEYQWSREQNGRLVRYGITLPLKGPYPGIRRFIAQALREHPSLALDTVSFGRQTAGDIGVDAQVRFTLFLRGETP